MIFIEGITNLKKYLSSNIKHTYIKQIYILDINYIFKNHLLDLKELLRYRILYNWDILCCKMAIFIQKIYDKFANQHLVYSDLGINFVIRIVDGAPVHALSMVFPIKQILVDTIVAGDSALCQELIKAGCNYLSKKQLIKSVLISLKID